MTFSIIFKAGAIWFVIAILAVINGIFRESILLPAVGQGVALPVSGIILSIIIFMVTYVTFKLFGNIDYQTFFFIGIQWLSMTLWQPWFHRFWWRRSGSYCNNSSMRIVQA